MSQLSGSFTVEIDTTRLGREVAAHILDAFNQAGFGDRLAEVVAHQVELEFAPYSGQGWHTEPVQPAWSGYCWLGEHDRCNGTAPPAERCTCPHHEGDPAGSVAHHRGPEPEQSAGKEQL